MKIQQRLGPVLLITVTVIFATTLVVMASDSKPPFDLPLPPTPGPVPTYAPEQLKREGTPIENREQAIKLALQVDAQRAVRAEPLTYEKVTSVPTLLEVEQVATRQEAANRYGAGGYVDTAVAAEPVWVIKINGKANIRKVGLNTGKSSEATNVTYIFSQKTSRLLSVIIDRRPPTQE